MAGFFEKFGEKVGEVFNKAAETAGDLTQTAKFKMEMSKYAGQIKDAQIDLGKKVVEARLEGASNDSLFPMIDEVVENVKNLQNEIKRVEQQIEDLKEDGEELVKNAGEAVEETKDEIVEKAEDLGEKVEDKVEEVKDEFKG